MDKELVLHYNADHLEPQYQQANEVTMYQNAQNSRAGLCLTIELLSVCHITRDTYSDLPLGPIKSIPR